MSSLAIVIIPALLFTKLYPSWSRNLEYEFENKLLNLQHQKFKHSTKQLQWINLYQYITQLVPGAYPVHGTIQLSNKEW